MQIDSHIEINKDKSKIRVVNNRQQLTYFVLSTQPGRKIHYPPVQIKQLDSSTKMLEFGFQNCEGISIDIQGYCAVGFNHNLNKIQHQIIKKPVGKVSQKILYISKINADFKPHSASYFSDTQNKYRFSFSILPPTDINASEIQWVLQNFMEQYGAVSKVDAKRNSLILLYQQQVEIKQNFIVKDFKQDQNNHLTLTYWAITNHRTLYTYEPIKLIQLPLKQKIKDYLIHSEWLIISTGTQVLFLHLYRPTQLFQSLNDVNIHSICFMDQDKVILFEYKFHLVYQLFSFKNPVLVGKAKTKKIQPYTIAFKKKTALLGGINYSAMLNQPTKEKEIYVIQNFVACNLPNKSFLADKKLYICKKSENTPVKNLKFLEKQDLFICSCGESIYLFHLDSSSLIASVDLTATISKLYQIDYPINIVNCLIRAKSEKYLVRIGFEQYGEIVGTEVSCVEKFGEIVDFTAEGKQICCTDGDNIILYGDDKNRVLFSAEGEGEKIKKIAMCGGFFSFLLCKQSVLEAYFMQL